MQLKTWRFIGVSFSLLVLLLLGQAQPASQAETPGCTSLGNPAYTYCTEIMGYEYQVVNYPDGSQDGVCMMPDGEKCSQWDFYSGKCGQDYSWCVQNGANLEIRQDGQDAFSRTYAVCVDDFGRELGTVWDLASQAVDILDSSDRATIPLEKISVLESVPDLPVQADLSSNVESVNAVPTSFDWRNYIGYNWVTPVKNQLDCGSCWAFSSVGLAEAQHNIMADDPELDLDLSEQYLVSDCFLDGNCDGGYDVYALEYIRDYGIPDEACYPYIAVDSSCELRCSDYIDRLKFLPNVYWLTSYDELTMKTKISSYGPITIAMGIDSNTYGGYWDEDDIYRCSHDIPSDGTPGVDHGVLAVGYDDAGGYWIVKNSWGSYWGDGGYFKLGYNECNVMQGRIGWTESDLPVIGKRYSIYLPAIMTSGETPDTGINGRVLLNGVPIGGIELDLILWDSDDNYTLVATTTTLSDGSYLFTSAPSLSYGDYYYVRYVNYLDPTKLFYWETPLISTYSAGSDFRISNFDIANVSYVSPLPDATVLIPTRFSWNRRLSTTTDSYEFNLIDPESGWYIFWTGPLGYVNSYTLDSLPTGVYNNTPYLWEIWIYSPDGGIGIAYEWWDVTFSTTSSSVLLPSTPYHDRFDFPLLENLTQKRIKIND